MAPDFARFRAAWENYGRAERYAELERCGHELDDVLDALASGPVTRTTAAELLRVALDLLGPAETAHHRRAAGLIQDVIRFLRRQ